MDTLQHETARDNDTAYRAALLSAYAHAVERGYKVHTCRLEWRDGEKTVTKGTGKKRWQHKPQESIDAARRRIEREGCNAYLVHCTESGVTLHDGDTPDDWSRIQAALGVTHHVKSANGGLHWYSAGIVKSSDDLKTKETAFGPGSFFEKDGQTVSYVGELPDKATLPRVSGARDLDEVGEKGPPAQGDDDVTENNPTDDFFAIPLAAAQAAALRKLAALGETHYEKGMRFRDRLMGVAFYLGGLLHTGEVTEDSARRALIHACEQVFPDGVDADDMTWIEQGLRDGSNKPVAVARETTSDPKESADELDALFLDRDQLRDMPRPEPLIDGVLFKHTVWALIGRDQTYKTFLALDWLLCLAMGEPWHGREVQRCKVLLVVGEGAHGLHDRVCAWEQHRSVKVDPAWFIVRRLPVNLFKGGRYIDHLCSYASTREVGVVAFDTLQRNSSGAAKNDDKDAGLTIDTLKSVAGATTMGCAGWLAHTQRTDEDTRGSSAWEDDLDVVWQLKASSGAVTATQTKSKYTAKDEPIEMSVVTVPTGEVDEKGRDVTSVVLVSGTGPTTRVDPEQPSDDTDIGVDVEQLVTLGGKGTALLRDVAEYMAHNAVDGVGRSRVEVARWLGRNTQDGSVRNAWDALVNLGAIVPDKGAGKTGRSHWVPQDER